MTIEELREAVFNGNDFYFMLNDIRAGVELTVKDYNETFDVWYGEFERKYKSFDSVVNDKIFNGKSIKELLENGIIEIDFS